MKASRDDLDGLLSLQQIDLDIKKQNKQLDELPQRMVIYTSRKKHEEVEAKREQVLALKKDASMRLNRIKDEDESLAGKEKSVEEVMNSTQGDFRNVEARSKELESISERREKLAEDREEVDAELKKISNVEDQLDTLDKDLKSKESSAMQSFQQEGSALKASIAELEEQRSEAAAKMSKEIVDLYNKTQTRLGGVAVSTLNGDKCGACRTPIDQGRLLDLKANAPLGVCPTCTRLLIIE